MMTPIETMIRETPLPEQHVVIITTRQVKAFCPGPYATYAINEAGVTSDLIYFTSAVAAEQYHSELVRRVALR